MNGGITILLQELCLLIDVFLCFGIPILGIVTCPARQYGGNPSGNYSSWNSRTISLSCHVFRPSTGTGY